MARKTPDYILKTIGISFGFAFAFIILEIAARILPATFNLKFNTEFTCESPIREEKVNKKCIRRFISDGIYTKGKFPPFPVRALKRINDLGQFSNVDFSRLNDNDGNLKILSIGDSYVEALQVENENSFHGLLNNFGTSAGKGITSTSIGSSGDPLSQYLIAVLFANNLTKLSEITLVLPIISNDFDESVKGYKSDLSGGVFNFNNPNQQTFEFIDWELNPRFGVLTELGITDFIKTNSALYRYLNLNNNTGKTLGQLLCKINIRRCDRSTTYAANILESTESNDPKRYKDSKMATDYFLGFIHTLRPSKLEKSNTIFVIDADRFPIYDKSKKKSEYFAKQRQYFITKAKDYGFTVIDMEPIFSGHYQENKQKFEFSNDAHWNSLGHEIVSNQIAKELELTLKSN